MATGLKNFHQQENTIWIGWPGIASDELTEGDISFLTNKMLTEYKCVPVFLNSDEIEGYYQNFANKTIWPLFHYFPILSEFNDDYWDEYRRINQKFYEIIEKYLEDQSVIWIHDYHLMILPRILKKRLYSVQIGFFLHIPFPSYEILRLIPWRKEIMEGILGADLIGFHTYDYTRHFLSCTRRILRLNDQMGIIDYHNRQIMVDAFPMGIDYHKFANCIDSPQTQKYIDKFRESIQNMKVILSIDRLDYTKGIPQRLNAYEKFLFDNPEWHEKITMIMCIAPSRTLGDTYADLKRKIDERISQINGHFSQMGWTPIQYFYKTIDFHELSALYSISDIILVTPLRDGMNLIVKEFIAAQKNRPGTVILSETAGAASELSEAILVNPNDIRAISNSISESLIRPVAERLKDMQKMNQRIQRYDIYKWAKDFLDSLQKVMKIQKKHHTKEFLENIQDEIISRYQKAKNCLILLDYDGTLREIEDKPMKASPTKEIRDILEKLIENEKNHVVIITGRDKITIDKWFSKYPIDIIAGHGIWRKKPKSSWETVKKLDNDWKKIIRPIIELYVDRTPGSLLEEKDYSLVWHYRNCEPELSTVRLGELRDEILDLTRNLNIGLLEGRKILEIKDLSISKGTTCQILELEYNPDFIIAIGDDFTDENMFKVLSKEAITIKVEHRTTAAKYTIDDPKAVRDFLTRMIS